MALCPKASFLLARAKAITRTGYENIISVTLVCLILRLTIQHLTLYLLMIKFEILHSHTFVLNPCDKYLFTDKHIKISIKLSTAFNLKNYKTTWLVPVAMSLDCVKKKVILEYI